MELFEVRYEPRWRSDRVGLGLSGDNFETFWKPIEEFIKNTPNAEVGYPILDGSGARGFLTTDHNFLDIPKVAVYFKADLETRRIVFLGLEDASVPESDDYPPEDLRR